MFVGKYVRILLPVRVMCYNYTSNVHNCCHYLTRLKCVLLIIVIETSSSPLKYFHACTVFVRLYHILPDVVCKVAIPILLYYR